MCATNDGNSFFRPMTKKDLEKISLVYKNIPKNLIQDMYGAMTSSNTVRPAVMLVILDGIDRLENGLHGNSSYGATFAYSALQIRDGGDGKIFHRFQDPIMIHIHDAMLQFALAERNMRMVQKVMVNWGYNLTHFCDCGCGITRDGDNYMQSTEYRSVNMVRSYGESIGAPVHTVANIDELPLQITDMHQHEVDGYKRIWDVLKNLPKEIWDGEAVLSKHFAYMTANKGGVYARSNNSGSGYSTKQALQAASHSP